MGADEALQPRLGARAAARGVLASIPTGASCRVVAQLPSRPQVPGILQLADAWGGGFSWTPFLSAATLMVSGAAPVNFSLGDSGVGAGGLLSRSEARHPRYASRNPVPTV